MRHMFKNKSTKQEWPNYSNGIHAYHRLKKGVSVSVFVTVTSRKPEYPRTELYLTVAGNTCIRHVSVSAEALKRIPYTRVSVRFTLAETLTAVMFPQLVNSEDTQLSVKFPEE